MVGRGDSGAPLVSDLNGANSLGGYVGKTNNSFAKKLNELRVAK